MGIIEDLQQAKRKVQGSGTENAKPPVTPST